MSHELTKVELDEKNLRDFTSRRTFKEAACSFGLVDKNVTFVNANLTLQFEQKTEVNTCDIGTGNTPFTH